MKITIDDEEHEELIYKKLNSIVFNKIKKYATQELHMPSMTTTKIEYFADMKENDAKKLKEEQENRKIKVSGSKKK